MRTAAIIIARGGSIRLPRKNVRMFCGLPLVAWSIIHAKATHGIDDVWLSTDDDEIAWIGENHGAEIIRRPDWPDANEVAASRPIAHALDTLDDWGRLPDRFVSLFPTSPLRLPDDVDKGLAHHFLTGAVHVWPVHKNRETVLYRDVHGIVARLHILDKHYGYMQSNTGLFSVMTTTFYRWYTGLLTKNVGDSDEILDEMAQNPANHPDTDGYYTECEQFQCVEVDTLPEFELAEVLMEHYILQGRGRAVYDDYKEMKK